MREETAGLQLSCLPLSPSSLSLARPGSWATIVGWGHTNLRDQAESATLIGQEPTRYWALIGQLMLALLFTVS